METKVKFLIEQESDGDVFAYFPEENYCEPLYGGTQKMSYSKIGQHSACHTDYAGKCTPATPTQYAELKAELESIGYKLKIVK